MKRKRAWGILAAALLAAPAGAQSYYLSVDVPTELPTPLDATADFQSNQIVERNDGVYRTTSSIDTTASIGAVVQRNDGVYRMASSSPSTLGGADYEPRDVFSFDGTNYAMVLDGSASGIPDYARIDSLFHDASNNLVLGFDVPVNLAGTEYGRSDLVLYSGGVFSLYWDAEDAAAGVPDYANMLDADTKDGDLFMVFDVPVTLGGAEYTPGQVVKWSASTGWSLYASDGASWPTYAQARGFCFIRYTSAPGGVPDGKDVPGTPLSVAAAGGDNITLSWGVSCSTAATGYVIYEGDLSTGYGSLAPLTGQCTTPLTGTTHTFTTAYAASFYVVVPQTSAEEGSYGRDNAGERVPPVSACRTQNAQICP